MSDLPASLLPPVTAALRSLGDASAIRSARLLGGGCINHAMRVETGQGRYLLKWNADPLPGLFEAEAHGLRLLAATRTVRVPEVYACAEVEENRPAFILMEWLEGRDQPRSLERLGEQIAQLHLEGLSPQNPPAYGLERDNYLGAVVQVNGWDTNWPRFFGERRLRPQMELAQRNGRLPPERRRCLERVIERLDDLLGGVSRRPSLTHGDLWGGNVIPGPDGLALIDPAVWYADRETEIAYSQLFQSFPPAFYAGYQSVWPLEPGYPERRDLYNLYHLVNHLNHFGESYGPRVDAVLRRFAG